MKYCPVCETSYGDEAQVCDLDGANLIQAASKEDPYLNRVIKGRYRVLQKLGRGGTGTVYLAEQISIKRRVALKVLAKDYARDEEFVKRFRQEAHLSATLNHRNVITVYDFDQSEDGSLFLAMEYVDGGDLKELIKSGPLDLSRVVRLGIQTAEGLGAAHSAGVIHRDIKPENIMIVRDLDEVKLTDFGIAKMMDAGTKGFTRPGMIIGTPEYMAPEQIDPSLGDVSERTDIYAFGIVLYEMLSGTVPFRASTPREICMMHLQRQPALLRKSRREIPLPLERIVMQALEKKSEKRQADGDEIAQQLRTAEERLKGDTGSRRGPAARAWDLFSGKAREEDPEKSANPTAEIHELPKHELPKTEIHELPRPELPKNESHELLKHESPKTEVHELPKHELPKAEIHELPKPEFPRQDEIASYKQDVPKTLLATQPFAGEEIYPSEPRIPIASRVVVSLAGVTRSITKALLSGSAVNRATASLAVLAVAGAIGISAYVIIDWIGGEDSKVNEPTKEDHPPPPQPDPLSLVLDAERKTLAPKDRMVLKVRGKYPDGKEQLISTDLNWQSTDASVASVTPDGQVEAQKEGAADITARYKGLKSLPVTLIVKAEEPPPPPRPTLVSLKVLSAKQELRVKERTILTVSGKYSDGKETEIQGGVVWKSSHRKIAFVDSKGAVTALKSGEVNLSASYEGLTSSINLTVKGAPEPPPVAVATTKKPESKQLQPSSSGSEALKERVENARLLYEDGNYNKAISILDGILKKDPEFKEARVLRTKAEHACKAEGNCGN